MKIGITCYPVRGGSGVVATELGLHLAKRGFEIHFISYNIPFRLQEYIPNLFYHQVEVMNYPLFKYPPYTLTLAAKMAEVARGWGLDIFHVHYAIPHAACAYLAKGIIGEGAPKVITTLHGTDITLVGIDESFKSITEFSINSSDGITTVSRYLKTQTERAFQIAKDMRVVYNFVDTDKFTPRQQACQRSQFATTEEKIIMHISNFRPVKRAEDVVKIFDLVSREIPSKLVLAGDGPDAAKALSLAERLGVKEKVIFLGSQNAVENILPCADIFLLPSQEESFGLAALEALSCGVPVVGYKSGGLVEVVEDGESGFLVKLGDAVAAKDKIVETLRDADKLHYHRQKARERAVNHFNAPDIIKHYISYYEEILNVR
ncbi:MAG: N-acetyl-alpha-D-glucosaminyl L-malate synthase BshA [candidate division Zixibacteria bacterium CG_4_9_14_3_um_filter_46_8]|nr:MAG: N-acetyl-alpha-D-glucosaminyl L-malate synthase BshA [candidate division Zixibacteria bacterium CG_4_9_14_3_um_filter_46_8]